MQLVPYLMALNTQKSIIGLALTVVQKIEILIIDQNF